MEEEPAPFDLPEALIEAVKSCVRNHDGKPFPDGDWRADKATQSTLEAMFAGAVIGLGGPAVFEKLMIATLRVGGDTEAIKSFVETFIRICKEAP